MTYFLALYVGDAYMDYRVSRSAIIKEGRRLISFREFEQLGIVPGLGVKNTTVSSSQPYDIFYFFALMSHEDGALFRLFNPMAEIKFISDYKQPNNIVEIDS